MLAQRPEYLGRYRKLGSYLATKVLVGHLRNRQLASFWRDLVRLRAAGLIDAQYRSPGPRPPRGQPLSQGDVGSGGAGGPERAAGELALGERARRCRLMSGC